MYPGSLAPSPQISILSQDSLPSIRGVAEMIQKYRLVLQAEYGFESYKICLSPRILLLLILKFVHNSFKLSFSIKRGTLDLPSSSGLFPTTRCENPWEVQ